MGTNSQDPTNVQERATERVTVAKERTIRHSCCRA